MLAIMLYSWVFYLLILILPACLPRKQARVLKADASSPLCASLEVDDLQKKSYHEDACSVPFDLESRLNVLSLEAKFSDIPIPVGSEPLYDFFAQPQSDDSVIFGYTNKATMQDLYNFFRMEFSRLGWNFLGGIVGLEGMLTVEKPDRVCSVSLRAVDNVTVVVIIMCPKKGV